MNQLQIRKLEQRDIQNGFLDCLNEFRESKDLTVEHAIELFQELELNPVQMVYVAVIDEQVVGCSTILLEQKFIHNGGKIAHLEDLVVRKKYQGQGIAEEIIKTLLSIAEKKGCYKTLSDCTDKILPFWQKIGFKNHENATRYDHGL